MRITLSQKHGVNPSIPLCYYCHEPKNEIVLAGRLPGDAEAPRHGVWDKVPCDKCLGYMEQGLMCISVRDGTPRDNPYRTGAMTVITKEAALRIFGEQNRDIIDHGVTFLEDSVWDKIGLPRGPVEGVPTE